MPCVEEVESTFRKMSTLCKVVYVCKVELKELVMHLYLREVDIRLQTFLSITRLR